MPSEACVEEFEALTAIFLDEINIGEEQPNGETKVSMVLFPATGDDQESKYVTLTLELTLPSEYPRVSPLIRFRNPRGLSETLLDSLYRAMKECCSERLESQMIFELVDMGKEFLTINNRPASECPICLLSFTPSDTFFRSQCFHHFHSYCLGRYLQNVAAVAASGEHLPGDEPGKTCPVCRENLDEDINVKKLLESPPPFEESLEISDGDAILKEWHLQQEKLKKLFEKQKSQGGIIDLSEIDKRRLVISSPRGAGDSESPSSSSDTSTGIVEGEVALPQRNGATQPQSVAPLSNRTKNEGRHKHVTALPLNLHPKNDKTYRCHNQQQPSVAISKPGPLPQESVPTSKQPQTSNLEEKVEPVGQQREVYSGKGKGGYSRHGRRRYK